MNIIIKALMLFMVFFSFVAIGCTSSGGDQNRENESKKTVVKDVITTPVRPAPPESESFLKILSRKKKEAINHKNRPNVLIIVVDCLRADHLGIYGYKRATSPTIDTFSNKAVRFDLAITQATWTLPSITTLMTGLYPHAHRVHFPNIKIPAGYDLVSEMFDRAGWITGGIVACTYASKELNFNQGFDFFDQSLGFGAAKNPTAKQLTNKAVGFLAKATPAPFFLYLHYFDPHMDYAPPAEFRSFGSRPVDLYDGEIAYTDRELGRLFEWMKDKGFWENTIVVLTADHGEELGEHNNVFEHGSTVYQAVARVPLIIKAPDIKPGVIETVTGLVDLAPTMLELTGVPADEQVDFDGISLAQLLKNPSGGKLKNGEKFALPNAGRTQYSSSMLNAADLSPINLTCAVSDSWKLIRNHRNGVVELYYLRDDPNEKKNVADLHPKIVAELEQQLKLHIATCKEKAEKLGQVDFEKIRDQKTIEMLRSLGYL